MGVNQNAMAPVIGDTEQRESRGDKVNALPGQAARVNASRFLTAGAESPGLGVVFSRTSAVVCIFH